MAIDYYLSSIAQGNSAARKSYDRLQVEVSIYKNQKNPGVIGVKTTVTPEYETQIVQPTITHQPTVQPSVLFSAQSKARIKMDMVIQNIVALAHQPNTSVQVQFKRLQIGISANDTN